MYVVGHTDPVGGYDYNKIAAVGAARAAAVVKELTGKHGILAARLKAAGARPIAPVAPNDSDPGRAKNRRVNWSSNSDRRPSPADVARIPRDCFAASDKAPQLIEPVLHEDQAL